MTVDTTVFLTILGMGLVTYMTRAGGMWLTGRVELSGRWLTWLRALPGAVLVSLVVPSVVAGGVADLVAAVATTFVACWSRNLLLSLAVGIAVVMAARYLTAL